MTIAFDLKAEQLLDWVYKAEYAAIIIDGGGRIALANSSFLSLLKLERSQVERVSYKRFLSVSADVKKCLLYPHLDHPRSRWLEGHFIHPSGEKLPMTAHMMSGYADEQYFHLLFCTPMIQNATPSPSQMVNRFAHQWVNDLEIGAFFLDDKGQVVAINHKACSLLGCCADDVIQRNYRESFRLLSEEGKELISTSARTKSSEAREISWGVKGREVVVMMDVRPLIDHEVRVEGFCITLLDITKIRAMEHELEGQNRLSMIGQIAAGTAHEIRNPLTSIRGFLQVLKHTLNENLHIKEYGYTEIMLREIDRINHLVGEFLHLSRPDVHKKEPLRIENVIERMLPVIQSEANLHNIKVNYQQPTLSLPMVLAEEKGLKQVFLNLCKNSIDAMGNGGTLSICLRRNESKRSIQIEVADTGAGIPVTVVDQIFEPFFTTKENGTGLGLAICRRIIDEIEGEITFHSTDSGVTFCVSIPMLADEEGNSKEGQGE
ncbi:nitrogen regulation protein NR(II) [Mechercharimyces sp. CAU 1602]|uniref:two-component system sensor histidine kinase NtrB n=1 Tax=Mechercharimyces sp. CAU 1602 TaxID=2973933 RepID=UPI002162AF5E|nr:PAS domain-containing sensor histidine kinase [Mechercharimyces sp. CAU 1602]MCS1352743.1 ATP-binding protein [Mechercharimyces sp. CAU 1602]